MLPSRLENARPAALERYARARDSGLLTGRISVSDEAQRGPYSTPDGDIVLPEPFAERLWAACFGLLVLPDAEQRWQNGLHQIAGPAGPPPSVVAAAGELLEHAIRGTLVPWPSGAPVPSTVFDASEALPSHPAFWAGRANGLFLDAAIMLLAHEAAHIVQAHAATLTHAKRVLADAALARAAARAAGAPPPPETEVEAAARQTVLELEREADAVARDEILGAGVGEHQLFARGYAVILTYTASVLLAGSPAALRQASHPDLDVRLRQALEALNPERAMAVARGGEDVPDTRDALWRVAAVGLGFAAREWKLEWELPPAVDTWASMASLLLDRMEEAKLALI